MPRTHIQTKYLDIDNFRVELLALTLAIYLSAFLNGTLWNVLLETQRNVLPTQRWTFFWVTSIGITAFQTAFISLFAWGRFAKIAVILLALVAAITHYFSNQYNILYDTGMIRNVLATNFQESSELITMKAATLMLLYLMPILIFVKYYQIPTISLKRQIFAKLLTLVVALGVSTIAAGTQFKSLSSAIRNRGEIRHLVLPASPVLALARAVGADTASASIQREPLDPAPQRMEKPGTKPLLTVVVVGETVRAQNWQLSGYKRETNPQLSLFPQGELFNFPYAKSCGTNTDTSLPCMFSGIGRSNYNEKWIRQHESILSLIHRTGVEVTWIDNQSGCKGACDGVTSLKASSAINKKKVTGDSFDDILSEALTAVISKTPTDQLVVLHMIGNHGPAYHQRYPKDRSHFKPTCEDNNLTSCSSEAIVNTYDNAIRYTDEILARIIRQLNQLQDRSVGLIYVSDHGESLGEKGLYLHGVPYALAPEEQTRVPFFFWFPERSQRELGLKRQCLTRKASHPTEHDLLAHSLLGLYRIFPPIYQKRWDFTLDCHE